MLKWIAVDQFSHCTRNVVTGKNKTLGTNKCVQIISECMFLVQGKNIFVESCVVGCIHAKIIFSLSHQPNSSQTSESNHVSHSAVALISVYSLYNHTRINNYGENWQEDGKGGNRKWGEKRTLKGVAKH